MKRASKGPKGKIKPDVLPEGQATKKYPPRRGLIVGKGLSKEQMIDAVMEFAEACEKEEAELNAKHKPF